MDLWEQTLKETKEALELLHSKGITFDQARILLVNRQGFTMGEAGRKIEFAESVTGIRLER